MNFHEVKDCDPVDNKIDLQVKISYSGDQSESASIAFNLPEDYGDELEGYLSIDKFENDAWKNGVFEQSKPLLDFLESFGGRAWKNFRNEIQPKIENPRQIPAGEYNLASYKETYLDLDMPQTFYGRFRVTVIVSNSDEPLVCKVVEVTITEPAPGL
ncbi:uncharacterized protein LOC123003938 [Tribolium madens]|uniref:uncharacterized protein LOC123003938 n=1 Tax=Tribolium madens TaxID=41895 RepID=UPI001CF761AE|nr:uncharacterized protein LOC123003938 [Tribolium madens]